MIYFDYIKKENIKGYNLNWPQISNYPYQILVIQGLGSGKTNALFNLIGCQRDFYKIYSYAKDLN